MQSLANCPRCEDVFVTSLRTVCPACYKKEENAFEIVYQFLKRQKNREATINEIAEATRVEEELIFKFVKENRLRASQFPNLTYSCERCGEPITSGNICSTCSYQFQRALEKHDAIEEKKQSIIKEQVQTTTYFALDYKRRQ